MNLPSTTIKSMNSKLNGIMNEWRSMASIVKKKVTGSTSISATFNLFDYMHLDGEAHREFFANIGGRG